MIATKGSRAKRCTTVVNSDQFKSLENNGTVCGGWIRHVRDGQDWTRPSAPRGASPVKLNKREINTPSRTRRALIKTRTVTQHRPLYSH